MRRKVLAREPQTFQALRKQISLVKLDLGIDQRNDSANAVFDITELTNTISAQIEKTVTRQISALSAQLLHQQPVSAIEHSYHNQPEVQYSSASHHQRDFSRDRDPSGCRTDNRDHSRDQRDHSRGRSNYRDITVKVVKTGTTQVDAPTRTTSMDTMNTGTTPTIAAMLTTYIDGLTREDSIIHMTDQEGTPLQDITETTRLTGNPAPVVVSHVQVDHNVLLLIPDAQTVTNSTIILECADSQNQPQKHSTIHMSNTTNRDTRLSLTRIGTTLTNHLL